MDKWVKELIRLVDENGLTFEAKANGHVQIKGGAVIVNWYPNSKFRTAYVAGTREGIKHADEHKVIALALCKTAPGTATTKPRQGQGTIARHRRRMMAKCPQCHWCGCTVYLQAPGVSWEVVATVDHVIPRSKGGLDHHNNYVLACAKCNKNRADSLPQMKQAS